ncbi:hypothetical protein Q5P01_006699 [Channa striata]|uniref:Uncharacterized protein n=1 Tax=Channa striata TaxID=64152 RepID=A0AA88NDK9_CHASR|nr:hypothetical protein Q5P01_006699 [Channa striata]
MFTSKKSTISLHLEPKDFKSDILAKVLKIQTKLNLRHRLVVLQQNPQIKMKSIQVYKRGEESQTLTACEFPASTILAELGQFLKTQPGGTFSLYRNLQYSALVGKIPSNFTCSVSFPSKLSYLIIYRSPDMTFTL